MASNARFASLVARYNKRQSELKTGAQYQPAIKAVRGEAPSLSRCCRIASPLYDRDVHTLSSSETAAALVALYHPALIDLLEQRCIRPEPAPNPASLYPEMCGQLLPGLPGTVAVADRLGLVGAR